MSQNNCAKLCHQKAFPLIFLHVKYFELVLLKIRPAQQIEFAIFCEMFFVERHGTAKKSKIHFIESDNKKYDAIYEGAV